MEPEPMQAKCSLKHVSKLKLFTHSLNCYCNTRALYTWTTHIFHVATHGYCKTMTTIFIKLIKLLIGGIHILLFIAVSPASMWNDDYILKHIHSQSHTCLQHTHYLHIPKRLPWIEYTEGKKRKPNFTQRTIDVQSHCKNQIYSMIHDRGNYIISLNT